MYSTPGDGGRHPRAEVICLAPRERALALRGVDGELGLLRRDELLAAVGVQVVHRELVDGRGKQQHLGVYKILFYFEAYMHESLISLLPPPTRTAYTIALLLHD